MFGFGRVPGIQAGLDVALEDLVEVVVAVELVFVGDTCKGLYGVEVTGISGSGAASGGIGMTQCGQHLNPGLWFSGQGVMDHSR